MREPKTLVMDIETAPMLAYVWGRRDQNIGVNQIKGDWFVLAWSGKWLGASPSSIVYYDQQHVKPMENDKGILKPMWRLLNEADIVITQNGKKFDSRKLNARFILNGMTPPSPYRHYDTLLLARNVADFTSAGLDYLTNKLCTKYKKLSHSKFPGMSLWQECLAGNAKAWAEMKKYNIHDVLSTEEMYTVIRAWAPASMPAVFHHGADVALACQVCGQVGYMQRRGETLTKKGVYQRYQCQNRKCRAWQQGKKIS